MSNNFKVTKVHWTAESMDMAAALKDQYAAMSQASREGCSYEQAEASSLYAESIEQAITAHLGTRNWEIICRSGVFVLATVRYNEEV